MRRIEPAILSKYIAVKTAVDTGVATILLVLLYAAADLVEVRAMSGIGIIELLQCYLYKLPSVASLLLPSAAGFGIAYETASLHRSGEWEAMQASGVSNWKTTARLLVVSMFLVPIAWVLSFWIAPLMTARFESHIRRFEKNPPPCLPSWTRHDRDLVRFDCNRQVDTVIGNFPEGNGIRRMSQMGAADETNQNIPQIAVWDKADGWYSNRGFLEDFSVFPQPVDAPLVNNLPGQSLTFAELNRAVLNTEQMGLSSAPLRAERSLRVAVVLACFIVPLGVLVLLTAFGISRAGPSILLCIAFAVVYWMISAIAWRGAAQGAWSDLWPASGAPLACFLAAVVAVLSKMIIDKFSFR